MNKNGITYGIIGLIVGLAIGFSVANYLNRNSVKKQQTAQNPATNSPTQTNNQPNGGMMGDVQAVLDKAKKDPSDFKAQIKAGEMFSQIQRFDEALAYYQKAQKIKPDDLEANIRLGGAHFNKKAYVEAEKYFRKALEIQPNNADVRGDLGLTFYMRDPSDDAKAISEYRAALKIDSKHEPSLQNLSLALDRIGDKEGLKKTLSQLKEVNPENQVFKKFGTEK